MKMKQDFSVLDSIVTTNTHASYLGIKLGIGLGYYGYSIHMFCNPFAGGLRPQGDKDDRAEKGGDPGNSQGVVHHGPDESGVALVIETFQHKLRIVRAIMNCGYLFMLLTSELILNISCYIFQCILSALDTVQVDPNTIKATHSSFSSNSCTIVSYWAGTSWLWDYSDVYRIELNSISDKLE